MKNYAKIGSKPGKPAYRTPSNFRSRKSVKIKKYANIKHYQRGI